MKKFISVMLALAMLISICVVPAMAEESAVVASVDGSDFMSFADAMDAVKDGSTVELYKPVILEEQLVIEKAITINGNGNKISSSTVQRMIWIKSDVTINDLTVENTKAAGRCIETRAGGLTLNLNNVTLNAESTAGGNTQALTIGGNAETAENRVKVNLDGCSINGGDIGYGIITFNPTDLLIKNSSAVCGYGAIYLKPADSSVGSAGTIVTIEKSDLRSGNENDSDKSSFGTIIVQDNNITVNIDASSKVSAISADGEYQYAILVSEYKNNTDNGANYTGLNVTINGLIYTDHYVGNLSNTSNKIVMGEGYAAAVEQEGHVVVPIGNGMISVWADHEHTYTNTVGELHLKSAANCTDAAVYYESCSICGLNGTKTFTNGTENGHDWDEGEVTTAPTCASTGVKTYTCQIVSCAKTKTEELPMAAHTLTKVDAKAATCTEDGNIEYYICKCGAMFNNEKGEKELTASEIVAAAPGHDLAKVDAKAPTCTEDGSIEYYACACGALFADAEGKKALTASEIADAMKGHTWDEGKVTTAATCTAKGVKTYTCACGATKTEEVAMAAHTLTKVEAKAAACTEAGNIEHYTCSGCKALFNNKKGEKVLTASEIVVAATGHTLTKVAAKEASYTAAGNVEYYTCACGALFTDAEGKTATTAEAVVIPQLIKIEENTAKVEDSAVDAAIAEAVKESTSSGTATEETKLEVVITVEDAKTEENKEEVAAVEQVELPVKALDKVAEKKADLVVVLPSAKVTVNTEALEAVSKQAEGEKVSLVVKEVKTETLTAAQKKTVEKLEVAVTITAELICQKTGEKIWTEEANKTEKTGNIKVEIPFTPAAGTKGSDYTVVYIDNNGKAKKVETTYVNGHLVFELEHFSDYVVINEAKTPLVETPETGDETRLVLLFSVMILSVVGVVSMAILSKKTRYVPKYIQK